MANPKISFLDRAIAAVSPTIALDRALARDRLVQFGFDSARPGTARGGSGGMAKNASSDNARMARDRVELMWEARDLERNMPIIRCVLDRVAQYVTGTIKYQAQTGGGPEVDSQFESYWENWCENLADITGRYNFRMLVELAFRSSLRDGDFGFQIVRNGRDLQLQCIEADRIGDPNKVGSQLDENYVQGIILDPDTGRPVAYDIHKRDRKSNKYTPDQEVEAEQFLFLNRPLRTDEYRTVSWLAPVIAPARDLYEYFTSERGAAKWASSIAGIIRTNDPHARGASASAGMWDGVTADGTPTASAQPNKLLRLKPNEDVTTFNTGNRPSGAFTGYVEAALRDIAMGLNVPYGFFDMSKFGGATVRLEAMQLDRMFRRNQEVLKSRILEKIKTIIFNNGIALGDLPEVDGWNNGRWQFGAHLTADTGYDTDANLALLQNGLKSASQVAGEEGNDFEELTDQLIKEATMMRDRCTAAGVPIEFLAAARFPQGTQQIAAVTAAQTPQTAPSIGDIGDGGAKAIADVIEMAANGTLPKKSAVALLVAVYGFSPAVANSIVPEKQKDAVDANKPAAPAAKPAGKGEVKKFEDQSLTVNFAAPQSLQVVRDPSGRITHLAPAPKE